MQNAHGSLGNLAISNQSMAHYMLQCIKTWGRPATRRRVGPRRVWIFVMSAQTANSQFPFQLPTLSYIDAKWEEPELRAPDCRAARQGLGLRAWLSRQFAGLAAWRRDSQALAELSSMSDHELMDIGLNRGDLPRVFQRPFNDDLHRRGSRV